MPAPLPSELLHAASEPSGRLALVLGAGCSLEPPTGLQLASVYSESAHAQLVLDHVIQDGGCSTPSDLSALASAVYSATGSQVDLVRRLPRNDFRMARPNSGYLIAAALLREGVINAVLTLNFDLAMTAALSELGAAEVAVVEGPTGISDLGQATLIYLHRNANENDLESWILRTEALDHEWQDGWEQVVVQRVLSCPVVVFAGLGSAAAALTETAGRIRAAVASDQHHVSVVDPYPNSKFAEALKPPAQAYVEDEWGSFMHSLSSRYLYTVMAAIDADCVDLCARHGWADDTAHAADASRRLHAIGIVGLGRVRARWLMESEPYVPDDPRRQLIADLLLGIALLEQSEGVKASFRDDGLVLFGQKGGGTTRLKPASGRGTLRWSALEPLIIQSVKGMRRADQPTHVLASGYVGGRGASVAPDDLIVGDTSDDIVAGGPGLSIITVDEIRDNPVLGAQAVNSGA
jgi:hypothetical protein